MCCCLISAKNTTRTLESFLDIFTVKMFQLQHQVKLRKQKHNFMNKPVHMSDTHFPLTWCLIWNQLHSFPPNKTIRSYDKKFTSIRSLSATIFLQWIRNKMIAQQILFQKLEEYYKDRTVHCWRRAKCILGQDNKLIIEPYYSTWVFCVFYYNPHSQK